MIAAIIIAVLVVVGGGVAAAVLLLGGDDDDSDGGDSASGALDTAQAYVDAIRDGDCGAAEDLSTDKLKESTPCDSDIMPPDDFEVDIGDPEITDESDTEATASVPVTVDGSDIPITLGLVNEDGEWLVDNFGAGSDAPAEGPSMPSMSMPTMPSISIPSFTIPTE